MKNHLNSRSKNVGGSSIMVDDLIMKNARLMKILLTATGILGALGAVFLATPANAASLATTQVGCYGSTTVSFGPASQSFTCNQVTGGANVYAATSIDGLWALARGSVTGQTSPTSRGWSAATVTYNFDIVAPVGYDPNLLVPLQVDTYLTTSVSGGDPNANQSMADASVHLSDYGALHNATAYACVHGGYPQDCGNSSFSGTVTGDFWANTLVTVTVGANITLANGPNGIAPAQAQAFADPYIQIDPAFLAAHPGYSLVFGANVTNAPPVPIPAAGWLFGSGLLGLIGVARRRN